MNNRRQERSSMFYGRQKTSQYHTNNTPSGSNCVISEEIVNMLHDLTSAIKELSGNIRMFQETLSHSNNLNCNKAHHTKFQEDVLTPCSYAEAVRRSTIVPSTSKENVLPASVVAEHFTGNYASKKCEPQDSFLAKLAALKNTRNEACFRMHRNEQISNLYEQGLTQVPRRIPRKFASKTNTRGDKVLAIHQQQMTIQSIENEVKSMRIHRDVQRRKMERFDRLARELIETECDARRREELSANYSRIIERSTMAIQQRLGKTIDFLSSSTHMILLHELNEQVLTTLPSCNTTIIEKQVDQPMLEQATVPRKTSSRRSTSSQQDTIAPNLSTTHQPSTTKTLHRATVARPKNWLGQIHRSRIKKPRQK